MNWREKYDSVLASDRWRQLKRIKKESTSGNCERCQSNWCGPFQLHHKDYRSLGREQPEDVEYLCVVCHEKADAERAEAGRQRGEMALYHAQLDGWATKKYGDGWGQWYEQTEEEFEEWLDRQ